MLTWQFTSARIFPRCIRYMLLGERRLPLLGPMVDAITLCNSQKRTFDPASCACIICQWLLAYAWSRTHHQTANSLLRIHFVAENFCPLITGHLQHSERQKADHS